MASLSEKLDAQPSREQGDEWLRPVVSVSKLRGPDPVRGSVPEPGKERGGGRFNATVGGGSKSNRKGPSRGAEGQPAPLDCIEGQGFVRGTSKPT